MSIHSSLKFSDALGGVRNVWTRAERLRALAKEGSWNEGDSVLALPKVRTHFKVKSKKQIKAAVGPTGETPAESEAETEKPAS